MGNRLGFSGLSGNGVDIDSSTTITISPRHGTKVILEKQDVIRNNKPVGFVHSCEQWDHNGRHRQWKEELWCKERENSKPKDNIKEKVSAVNRQGSCCSETKFEKLCPLQN